MEKVAIMEMGIGSVNKTLVSNKGKGAITFSALIVPRLKFNNL